MCYDAQLKRSSNKQHNFILSENKDTCSAKNDCLSSGLITKKWGIFTKIYSLLYFGNYV